MPFVGDNIKNREDKAKQEESESTRVPLVEGKTKCIQKGSYIQRSYFGEEPLTETKTVEVPVMHEELIVERRPHTEATTSQSELKPPFTTRKEIKIPLKKEEVEVKKEPYPKEVVIKKKRIEESKTITEDVKSEKLADDGTGSNFK